MITRIAVRPPEFLPRLAYFALMSQVDIFVVADTFQYSRQSFHNRTRLRTPNGWQWQSIPLVAGQHGLAINRTRISPQSVVWKRKLLRSLEFNYRSTPFFEHFEEDLMRSVTSKTSLLGEYTSAALIVIHRLLELQSTVVFASTIVEEARAVSDVLEFFEKAQLVVLEDTLQVDAASGCHVEVLEYEEPTYRQNFAGFEPGMSTVDALFNLGAAATRDLFDHSSR